MSELARLTFPALRWRSATGFRHEEPRIEATLKLGVGGYIIFGGKADAVRALTGRLQRAASHPLLIGSDFERGAGQQLDGLTHLPAAAALGFLDREDIASECGAITAREARSVGINWVYAPVADLDIEPDNPIVQTRSLGDDPGRVGKLVAAWIRGAQNEGVIASAKHYPGHGRTTTDSHASLPDVTTPLAELQVTDLAPFRAAIEAGVRSIMGAHVSYSAWDQSALPATMSAGILGYLRNELGFGGVIVTDALIMEGALRGRGEARASVDAVRAGCDALLYPVRADAVAAALEAEAGRDPGFAQRASDAVARVAALSDLTTRDPVVADLAENRKFADATADLALHILRGDSLNLHGPLSLLTVDDDIGGPYSVGPRGILARDLRTAGIPLGPGGSRVVVLFSEPRSWKGHAMLSKASLAAVDRLAPGAALVLLFGHPRLASQIPGDAPILCAWHGQPLMQEAVARWIKERTRQKSEK